MMQLKPCPFCGRGVEYLDVEKENFGYTGNIFILCNGCEAQGPKCKSKRSAVKSWNREVKNKVKYDEKSK